MSLARFILLPSLLILGCAAPREPVIPMQGAPTPKAPAPPPLGPDTRNYDQEHLALDLDLDLENQQLTGTATHTMTALADLSQVRVHLMDMKVSGVTSDGGAKCGASQSDDILTIDLDHPRKKGERFTLAIRYGGKPKSGLWFFKPTPEHPEVPLQVWSQGEGEENRHWIPCYDLPDDRLTSSLRVSVPATLQTLSNGVETRTEALAGGRAAHTWTQERAHVSYLITLVVGTFDDVKRDAAGVEQHDLVAPGWAPWAGEVFGRTPDMMGFFQDYTGQKYAWPRYSQVTVWDFHWGGMENTGATTLNMRALHKEGVRPDYSADGLVAHELAHQWFGDLITCRTMNHIWLNEGFATYFTDLWGEHAEGADDFAVACLGEREGYMNGVDLKETAAKARPEKDAECADIAAHPYVKGASVLHMLSGLIGRDVFREGIRRYFRENHDRSVETGAFRAAMEAESRQDLKWFFEQWVYRSGFPELTVSTSRNGRGEIRMLVEQTQPVTATMPLFRLPADVELRSGERRATVRIEVTQARQEFSFDPKQAFPDVDQAIVDVVFDPDHALLARIHETLPTRTWADRLMFGRNSVERLLAARVLADFGPAIVKELGRAAVSDASYSVRAEACAALGKIHDDAAARALMAAASDKDTRVRRAAMTAMGECKAEIVGDALKKALASDPAVYVAADAAAALGKCRAAGAYEALVEGLKRESHRDQVRQRIMDGLKELGDTRGAAIAMGHLDYSWGKGIQHQLRHSAFDAMVALAPDAAETRTWIVKLLRDPYFRMQTWAAEASAKLKIGGALPAMLELAETGTGPGVREAMKTNAGKLRDALCATKDCKSPGEAAAVRAAIESKMKQLAEDRAKLAKELEAAR